MQRSRLLFPRMLNPTNYNVVDIFHPMLCFKQPKKTIYLRLTRFNFFNRLSSYISCRNCFSFCDDAFSIFWILSNSQFNSIFARIRNPSNKSDAPFGLPRSLANALYSLLSSLSIFESSIAFSRSEIAPS